MSSNPSRNSIFNIQYTSLGFTLLELLIVIAVIGGLAAIAVATFPAAGKRAKDATRMNDMKQYQTAMETYNNKVGSYYVTTGTPDATDCGATGLNLPACPKDSKATWNYTLNSTATQYVIYSQLEQPQTGATSYFVVCSDGRSGECTTSPGAATACAAGCP